MRSVEDSANIGLQQQETIPSGMDLIMTATEASANAENNVDETPEQNASTDDSIFNENLKPDYVGGQDITSTRGYFDLDDKNIVVASERQLFYYSIETQQQAGKAAIDPSKLAPGEKVVAFEKHGLQLYLFTCLGQLFVWDLELRDWTNELAVPLEENEKLISCKLVSKRQYLYSVSEPESQTVKLYIARAKSDRERPKYREFVGECTSGELVSFDVGVLGKKPSLVDNKTGVQKLICYFEGSTAYFQPILVNKKIRTHRSKQMIPQKFTCIRANPCQALVAAGDDLGRISLFTGEIEDNQFNRCRLHWHSMPVSDICFSSTGHTMYSVGGESGCVVIWDLSLDNLGKNKVIARLGLPIRFINCSTHHNQLVMSFEDNELQYMDTNNATKRMKTFTRRAIQMYQANDYKALRLKSINNEEVSSKFAGFQWHSKSDTVVTNSRTGWLQFYSPKERSRISNLNFLKSKIYSLETDVRVVPSDITNFSITPDGNWIALYETRELEGAFPEVKLHIWQRSSLTERWVWIQTADRLHESSSIADLRFSPDGQFLISVGEDGTFHVLHRVQLDAKMNEKSTSKQMYAKGFVGKVPATLPDMAAFSQDSSVMAMSLKNDTALIWMIVDPYKLVYECQVNQIDPESEAAKGDDEQNPSEMATNRVLGLHFGYHKPSKSLAPLCEVRSKSIRIWNILNPLEAMEHSIPADKEEELTAAAFHQSSCDGSSPDHFAVCNRRNKVLLFKLHLIPTTRTLQPLIMIDATLSMVDPMRPSYYTHMCFMKDPISEIDPQIHHDPQILGLMNRLCLMNNYLELVSITDKLTLERELASNSCNAIKTYDMSELQAYFTKSLTTNQSEQTKPCKSDEMDSTKITEKQRNIRNRLEVQKMLKDLLMRIPSQNLPNMETLGPMILDKLT